VCVIAELFGVRYVQVRASACSITKLCQLPSFFVWFFWCFFLDGLFVSEYSSMLHECSRIWIDLFVMNRLRLRCLLILTRYV